MDAGSKMEQKVNKVKLQEKEKIQRNEARLTKEMDSLEQLLRTPIKDHQSTIKKKEAVESLRDIIEEYETELDKKSKIKKDLQQKMANLNDSGDVHKNIHIAMGEVSNEPKNLTMNGVPVEQMENLREQLASQSQQIKQMLQNQTLLLELRGQLRGEEFEKSSKISAELEKENNKLKTEVESLNKELELVNEQLTKAKEQVENEQAQVETLREGMAILLPQHSMRLEALSKEVEREKAILTQMEMNLVGSKRNFDLQIDHFKAKFENLKNLHITEVTDLRLRIKILSNKKTSKRQEDIDISEVHRQILVASSVFGADDSECYRNLVYDLVKKAIDAKINQMAKKHEDSINKINETWEAKMKSELNKNNQFEKCCEKLKKENLLLREKCAEHSQRLSLEKDVHWQAKLKGIENSVKLEVKTKYENEIANLKLSLDNASKERSSAEAKSSALSQQVNDLKKKFQGQKNEMVTEFKNKLSLLEKELKDRRDAEMARQQVIERLREDLQYQLQREKNLVERHREEVANLHKFFEAKLVDEIKKIQLSQMEEFRKLKDTKEKNIEALCNNLYAQYEERLKSIQEEYAKKLAKEQAKTEKRIEEARRREVENLRRDFEEKLCVEEGKRTHLRLTYLRQVEKIKKMIRDQ